MTLSLTQVCHSPIRCFLTLPIFLLQTILTIFLTLPIFSPSFEPTFLLSRGVCDRAETAEEVAGGAAWQWWVANLTKEETELVYNTYSDHVGVQYAESIMNFSR